MLGAPTSQEIAESSELFASYDRQIKEAEEVIAHPPLKKKAIDKLLLGLRGAIENFHDKRTVGDILNLLPSFDSLSEANQTSFVTCFESAVRLARNEVVDLFISDDYVVKLKGEHLVDGLQCAVNTVGSAVRSLVTALETIKNFQLDDPLIESKMLNVLDELYNQEQGGLATRLLNKYPISAGNLLHGLQRAAIGRPNHPGLEGFSAALEKCDNDELADPTLEEHLFYVLKELFNKGQGDLATRLLNEHPVSTPNLLYGLKNALANGDNHAGVTGFGSALDRVDTTELDDLEEEYFDVLKALFNAGQSELATRLLLAKHPLSAEYILEGLEQATCEAGFSGFGTALELCDSAELDNPATAQKMYQVLQRLVVNCQDGLARKLLEKHQNIALMYLAPLAEFCMQHRHTDMLAYLFLQDSQFEVISLENMVAGLMRWLPEDETIREEHFAGPFKLLEYILSNAEESLTPHECEVILMRLQKADAIEWFQWLFEKNNEELSFEYLNNRLTYALEKNQTKLVPVLMKTCQREPEVWDRFLWSPSLEMFKQVIINQRQHLLPLLLNSAPNPRFVGVVNNALAYAASIGEKEMVHTILEKLKELKCQIDNRAAVEIAIRNEKYDVVVYLFNNLPGLTMQDKMASVDFAPASFRETMISLVNAQALVEQRLKAVVSELPMEGLTDDNLNTCMIEAMMKLEKMRIVGEEPFEPEQESPLLLMSRSPRDRAANNSENADNPMQEVPLADGPRKRAQSLGSLIK